MVHPAPRTPEELGAVKVSDASRDELPCYDVPAGSPVERRLLNAWRLQVEGKRDFGMHGFPASHLWASLGGGSAPAAPATRAGETGNLFE